MAWAILFTWRKKASKLKQFWLIRRIIHFAFVSSLSLTAEQKVDFLVRNLLETRGKCMHAMHRTTIAWKILSNLTLLWLRNLYLIDMYLSIASFMIRLTRVSSQIIKYGESFNTLSCCWMKRMAQTKPSLLTHEPAISSSV